MARARHIRVRELVNQDQRGSARKSGIEIEFLAGYGPTGADIPAAIILGLKMLISYLYANRGDCTCDSAGAKSAIGSSGAAMLLDNYRIIGMR